MLGLGCMVALAAIAPVLAALVMSSSFYDALAQLRRAMMREGVAILAVYGALGGVMLLAFSIAYCRALRNSLRSGRGVVASASGALSALFGVAARVDEPGTPAEPGAVGLYNLGTSCYMNGTLQALVAIPEVSAYFLSGEYKGHRECAAERTLTVDHRDPTHSPLVRCCGAVSDVASRWHPPSHASLAPLRFLFALQ